MIANHAMNAVLNTVGNYQWGKRNTDDVGHDAIGHDGASHDAIGHDLQSAQVP